jgi:[acyl-carrier-protein] S-malonyltransferase
VSKIAFLFPGQGAQTVGMGQQACQQLPAAQALFDRANEILGYDLSEVCWKGPAEKLDQTSYSQPALFVAGLVGLEKLKAEKPEVVAACELTAGLSLGEYTALVFAGVMSFEDALKVVQERGRAMQDAADRVPSGMVSLLGLEREKIEEICRETRQGDEILQIANMLCPGNIVVSGHKSACERVVDVATKAGAMKCIPLAVAGAFHTPLMQPAVERLTAALANVKLSPPRIPYVSNVDAKVHTEPEEIRKLLVQQVCSPVLFEDSLRWMLAQGVTTFYEVGPGRVLRGLLKRIDRKVGTEGTLD